MLLNNLRARKIVPAAVKPVPVTFVCPALI